MMIKIGNLGKVFISKNLNLNKLSEKKKNNFIEKLYLLETK